MESQLKIGAVLNKETADNAASAVEQILKAGFDYRVSDKVMLKSLDVLKAAVAINGVSISNCNFENDQSKKVEIIVPKDYEQSTTTGIKIN